LSRDQRLCGPAGQLRLVADDVQQSVSLVGFRAGEREPDRQPAHSGKQVQLQSPEVAGWLAQ
jgi:hypothetical protein